MLTLIVLVALIAAVVIGNVCRSHEDAADTHTELVGSRTTHTHR